MLDWKNEAVDSLKLFKAREVALEIIPFEIEEICYDIRKTANAVADGLPVDSVKDIQLSRKIMIRKLEHRLETTKKVVKTTQKALDSLSEEDRYILNEFFISNRGKRLADIGDELGCSLATMYRKKDAALWRYAISLYGIEA